MPQQPLHKCQNQCAYLPAIARSKRRKLLDLALLSGTGARFISIPILTLEIGILFRLGERGALALGGGFGRLAATASGLVGLALGRRFRRGTLLAVFQGVDVLSHSSSAVAYNLSDGFV